MPDAYTTVPLLLVSLLALSAAHGSERLHAQESTSALVDGRTVAVSAARAVWRNPAGHRFSGSMFGIHLRDHGSDFLGFEAGLSVLQDLIGQNFLIDAGGTYTYWIGKGAALIRGGGFAGLLTSGGIRVGAYAGAGGLYSITQSIGISAEVGSRWIRFSDRIWIVGVGLAVGMD